ncbi:hypothetical protein TSH100_04095 [Azospirillum sp. TSH100]|uniref:hypothetical protein n=1 Tax=Azospirillum sp. TSH100 TaxID=652764 RepID=UPI000D60B4D8|nr:hypothetical protein [Azospirillum sp. TSH100]PWC89827.1 hypothetical protein TSH100_04095 [Azospirillum sp. TSH100]QCG92304.1 hypothetical protein E6C72_31350 [Azospirillum sp. TSH100]
MMDEAITAFQQHQLARKEMVDTLPDGGATIIVLTNAVGRLVREVILALRGPAVARQCQIVAVNRRCDLEKLMGLRGHVVLDPSFSDRASEDVRRAASALLYVDGQGVPRRLCAPPDAV